MTSFILMTAAVLILCVFSDRLSGKIGVPALLIFIGIGILFGSDGIFKIPFENYSFASDVCETALIVIMFTGGFSVKWETAKPVIIKAGVLSTFGVAVTAGITALFCYFVLKFGMAESFLIGSVISSTDAASVFSVLRSKKLGLKNGLAPLLEAESGSNDPFSYMLTIIALTIYRGGEINFIWGMVASQLIFGVMTGIGVGLAATFTSRHFTAATDGFECILFLAAALLAYGVSSLIGGNGYLSVYIAGIILGNARISRKREAVIFLNGVTGLCQIAVFFLLGLLSAPSQFGKSLMFAVPVFLCLTLLSRPIAAALFCGKSPIKDRIFVSLAGLRGASSIVFAIMAVVQIGETEHNIFNIVFCVCLMSMLIQGSVLPAAARKLGLIDDNSDVLKTFNDYREDSSMTMMRMYIPKGHPWENKKLSDVTLPEGSLAVMIRRGKETVVPKGSTLIEAEDSVILSVPPFDTETGMKLREIHIDGSNPWLGCHIRNLRLPDRLLIVMIKRGGESIIPSGDTEIRGGDIVVVTDTEEENLVVSGSQ